ncbi:hypothetical protein ES705_06970 [subsurface metagenome]
MVDKQKQMIDIMLKELKHIPEWSKPQRQLRLIYSRNRMRSLGKKAEMPKTPKEVLEESISALRGEYPDFKFEYDQEFFNKAD